MSFLKNGKQIAVFHFWLLISNSAVHSQSPFKASKFCSSEEKTFNFLTQFIRQEFSGANVNLIYDSNDHFCEHLREKFHKNIWNVTSATVTVYMPGLPTRPGEKDSSSSPLEKELIGKHMHKHTSWIELNIVIFFDGNHADTNLENLILLHDFQRQNSFNIFWQRENRNENFLEIPGLQRLKYKIELITADSKEIDVMSRCFYCDDGLPMNVYIATLKGSTTSTYPRKSELFPDFTKDFKGKVFRVALTRGIPTMMGFKRLRNGRIEPNGGFQTRLFQLMRKKLNFEYNISLENTFGIPGPNGTYSGMIGAVQTGSADLGIGAAVTHGRHQVIHYLTPNTFHLVTFITANAQPRPEWQTIFLAFTVPLWFSIICVAGFFVYPTFILGNTFSQTKDPDSLFKILVNGVGFIYRAIFDQHWSQGVTQKSLKINSIRILALFWLLSAFLIGMEFKCNLMKLAVSPPLEKLPSTFNQLANSDYSIYTHYAGGSLDRIVRSTHSQTFEKISQKMKTEASITKCLQETLKGRTACISYEDDAVIEGQKNFTDPYGHLYIHKAPMSAFNFYASVVLPKEAVYIESMESTVSQIVDMGITKKFHDEQYEISRTKGRHWAKTRKQDQVSVPIYSDHHYEKLRVAHFLGTVAILGIGFTMATVAWLVERHNDDRIVEISDQDLDWKERLMEFVRKNPYLSTAMLMTGKGTRGENEEDEEEAAITRIEVEEDTQITVLE